MTDYSEAVSYIYHNYEEIREGSVPSAGIRHSHIVPVLNRIERENQFPVADVGFSTEMRKLRGVELGHGKTRLFFWSQMHGDESTATGSIFDVLNFFSAANPHFHAEKEKTLSNLTMIFLPMVNPDGAEQITRYNAHGIDINRDAKGLRSPEGRILMETFLKVRPDYAFNLHDQSTRYSAGSSNKQVMFAFLAPPPDEHKTIPENRARAMALIQSMNTLIDRYYPGHTARYGDDFEPRAFGDTFQSLGAATILIECGGWRADPDKNLIRKMHTMLLLDSIFRIAYHRIPEFSLQSYLTIPENMNLLYDLVIRNVRLGERAIDPCADIGINRRTIGGRKASGIFESEIIEIGDIGEMNGIREIDGTGLRVETLTLKGLSRFERLVGGTPLNYQAIKTYLESQTGGASKIIPFRNGAHPVFLLRDADREKYLICGTELFDLTLHPA